MVAGNKEEAKRAVVVSTTNAAWAYLSFASVGIKTAGPADGAATAASDAATATAASSATTAAAQATTTATAQAGQEVACYL